MNIENNLLQKQSQQSTSHYGAHKGPISAINFLLIINQLSRINSLHTHMMTHMQQKSSINFLNEPAFGTTIKNLGNKSTTNFTTESLNFFNKRSLTKIQAAHHHAMILILEISSINNQKCHAYWIDIKEKIVEN